LTDGEDRVTLTGIMVKAKLRDKSVEKPDDKAALLQKLEESAKTMVQGAISEVRRRCGDEGCACYRDPARRHGPHIYLTYRTEGKSRSVYIPAEEGAEVKEAHAAWLRFTEAGSEISAMNRDRLLKGVEERKRKGAVKEEKQGRRGRQGQQRRAGK
jgi:hypothetical protein